MYNRIVDEITEQKSKDIYLFGAGSFGVTILHFLNDNNIDIKGFIDNDPNKVGYLFSKPVFDFENFNETRKTNSYIIICSTYWREIEAQINKFNLEYYIFPLEVVSGIGFEKYYQENKSRFIFMKDKLADEDSKNVFTSVIQSRICGDLRELERSPYPQYLHPKVRAYAGNVIIDGGAYTGDTVIFFENETNQNCEIHAFEPAVDTYSMLIKTIEKKKYINVHPIQRGLGLKSSLAKINFDKSIPAGSTLELNSTGGDIEIISIDEYVNINHIETIDLIKLDVEGFELSALEGAFNSISKFKPNLQVCVYHSHEDFIRLFEYINRNWEYKFYFGHHSKDMYESVLYCESIK